MKRLRKAICMMLPVFILISGVQVYAEELHEDSIAEELQEVAECVASNKDEAAVCGESLVTEGSCGAGTTWKYDGSGTLTISGNGFMNDFNTGSILWETGSSAPWYKAGLGSEIKTVIIEDGVTTIGDYAFNSCNAMESVSIPDSVTEIGKRAFANCSSLRSIELPSSVGRVGEYLCFKCTALEKAVFAANKGVLDDCSFYMCERLKEVRILEGCKSIEESVFYECKRLEKVCIPISVTAINYYTFNGCVYLQEIEYDGAEDDWFKIPKMGGKPITEAKVTCLWHYVKFLPALGPEVDPVKVKHGEIAQKPADPVRPGYQFTGWYLADGSKKLYDFTEPVLGPVTVYAGYDVLPPDNRNHRVLTEEDYIKMTEKALARGSGDAYDTAAVKQVGKKYYTEVSGNEAVLTVARGNKFYLRGDLGSFSSKVPGCVKVNSKGLVYAKNEYEPDEDADFEELYVPIHFTENGEEKILYVDIIDPCVDLDYSMNATSLKSLQAETTTGAEFDIAVWSPINVKYDFQKIKNKSVDNLSIMPQIDKEEYTVIINGQQTKGYEYYWEYHITGVATKKGRITVPFSVNGKKFRLKIKVR